MSFLSQLIAFLAAVSMIFAQSMYSATVAGEQENGGCTDWHVIDMTQLLKDSGK